MAERPVSRGRQVIGSGASSAGRAVALALALAILVPQPATAREPGALPVRVVGVVFDGPAPGGQEISLARYGEMIRLVERELGALTERDLDVRFPADKQRQGDWSLAGIDEAIESLLADPAVDILITAGILASNRVIQREPPLPKPVIAPVAVDIEAQGLPFALDDRGRIVRTGVTNLNYLATPGSILGDIAKFHELVPFTRLHVLTDSLIAEAIPELAARAIAGGQRMGVELILVAVESEAAPVLEQIPPDAEAVYVTPLNRLPDAERRALLDGLTERKLPTFSLLGRQEVELGLLAGFRPASEPLRNARRIALNIQRILEGEKAGDLPVILDLQGGLVINMAVARRIGFSPPWRVEIQAELLNEEPEEPARPISFFDVVQQALDANLALATSRRFVVAGEEEISRARSFYRPQIELSVSGLQINAESAEASAGSRAERTASGRLGLTQTIFSDPALADIRISRERQSEREHDWETARLDVALDASTAFLEVLRAAAQERIERENLELTGQNLELAVRRQRIGVSGPGEVYRWESQIATDRSTVIAARNRTREVRVRLNQVINRPLEERFVAIPPNLEDPRMLTCCDRIDPFVESPASYSVFRDFSVEEGLRNAWELRALDASIAAQERARLAARRSFWAPDLSLEAEVQHDFSRTGAGTEAPLLAPPFDRWSLGLFARLPLYAGGARRADLRQTTEELAGLRLDRDNLAQQIEAQVRIALFRAGSTFPAIGLSREAAEAAGRNLELVTDSYSRGTVSIIDLLDAQNQALVAKEFAANAVFDFLIDLMRVERATSAFDFFASVEGRRAWLDRLERYYASRGVRVRARRR